MRNRSVDYRTKNRWIWFCFFTSVFGLNRKNPRSAWGRSILLGACSCSARFASPSLLLGPCVVTARLYWTRRARSLLETGEAEPPWSLHAPPLRACLRCHRTEHRAEHQTSYNKKPKPKKPIFWFGSAQFGSVYGFWWFFAQPKHGANNGFRIKKGWNKKNYENKDKS